MLFFFKDMDLNVHMFYIPGGLLSECAVMAVLRPIL
jgi:hypothetical protein